MKPRTLNDRMERLRLQTGSLFVDLAWCTNGWRIMLRRVDGSQRMVGSGDHALAAVADAERRVAELLAGAQQAAASQDFTAALWEQTADWNASRGPRKEATA